MRVEIEREVATKMVNVYVVQDGFGDGRAQVWTPLAALDVVHSEDRRGDWTEVAVGASAPVSLRVPEEVWVAMVAAGSDVPMPTRAQGDHLKDAVEVRDRLLTLVEQGFAAPRFLTAPEVKP